MKKNNSPQPIIAFIFGACIGAGFVYLFLQTVTGPGYIHPIADPFDTEYHVHADFQIFVGDTQVDLTDDMFMTTGTNKRSEDAHLHDGNGEVQHIHSENVTFASFLQSLGITLSADCLTLFEEDAMCSTPEQQVQLYVNEELYTEPLTEYEPVDDDRILLYYGNPENENVQTYNQEIPSDSCYYSGTCPERGIAPPESCGLTCELE
jgi:hypothetical protein